MCPDGCNSRDVDGGLSLIPVIPFGVLLAFHKSTSGAMGSRFVFFSPARARSRSPGVRYLCHWDLAASHERETYSGPGMRDWHGVDHARLELTQQHANCFALLLQSHCLLQKRSF